ncbi:hypothetical protein L6R52_17320 [Myxococcota bacterium]|nr:hypothetical protein [Myxococcota bacterium]
MGSERRSVLIEVEVTESDGELVVSLLQSEVAMVALELTLLLQSLASEVRLRAKRGPRCALRIPTPEAGESRISMPAAGDFVFELTADAVGYLQAYLLRAHRDGLAEVSHVHVDAVGPRGPFALTVMCELYQGPMSADQAKRLLDDE